MQPSMRIAGKQSSYPWIRWMLKRTFQSKVGFDPDPGPAEQFEEVETNQAILEALCKLTPHQRAAVVMRYYLEMSESEMAIKLDSPKSSLKWWLHSARVRLHDLLQAFEPADGQPDAGKEKLR